MSNSASTRPTRIVILGGGFGGVYAAIHMESLLKRRDDVEIALVNKENYFVFQPLLAEVVSGNIGLLDTVSPLRRLLTNTRLYIRDVDEVDLDARTVTLSPGFRPRPRVIEFDHLVLALGSVTDFRGIAGLHEHALPFKNLADAVRLRNHLIHAMEEASIEEDEGLRRRLLTFVVAGGGFSGVEVAAEMNDFLRRIARRYRSIKAAEIRVILVHSRQRILEQELNESLGRYAQRILQRRGVELLLERRLKTASPDAAILDNGERIETKTLVSTVPSSANPIVEALAIEKERGKVKVDRHLRSLSHPYVWAVGDCALVPNSTGQGFSPPTAQHAVRQAKVAAQNIAATIKQAPLRSFNFEGLGKMGSLGHRSAVAELFGRVKLSGFLAWLMWRTVYWWKLPGVDRKIKVGVAWLLDLLIPPDFIQLKVGGAQGMSQAHYEPGDEVFHQGDMGDAFYIILDGQADVIVQDGAQERVINQLGPGDYFGEMALLRQRARTATVRSRTPLDVLVLRGAEFSALAANLPELRSGLENVMHQRLQRSDDVESAEA